jgi:hypothetical protein
MKDVVNIFAPYNVSSPSSFLTQAFRLGGELFGRGYEVNFYNIYDHNEVAKGAYNIYMPFHYSVTYEGKHKIPPYANDTFPDLAKLDFDVEPNAILVGIADKEKVSEKVLEKVKEKNYDTFIVSSIMQKNIFNLPKTRVIPWTLPSDFNMYQPILQSNEKVPIFFIDAHTDYIRRGVDIAFKVFDKLYEENYKFAVIVHKWNKEFTLGKRAYSVTEFDGYMNDFTYYGMLKSCTHFLSPLRGGSFEISTLEALASGLTVIIPEGSPSSEIPLSKDDVYWCQYNSNKIETWDNIFHMGKMKDIDFNSVLEATRKSLEKPKVIQKNNYLRNYNMSKWATKYLD